MAPVHREVHDDAIVLSHDAMDGRRRVIQVLVEDRERLPQAFPALRTRGVLHKILRDQIECGAVPPFEGLLKGQHGLRGRHHVITHEGRPTEGPSVPSHRLTGMRAVQITRFGGPEVLDIVDVPEPTPGPGQQLYDVSTAGLNFADTHHHPSCN
jgi:hypothetical protein